MREAPRVTRLRLIERLKGRSKIGSAGRCNHGIGTKANGENQNEARDVDRSPVNAVVEKGRQEE